MIFELGLIELKQRGSQMPNLGVEFSGTDFTAVAEAMGGHGATVRDRAGLNAALKKEKTTGQNLKNQAAASANRAKELQSEVAALKKKFGKDSTKIGGKGGARRTKKIHKKENANEDKKLKSTIKKFGMQSLQDIDEVNMFKDDNTVIHLKRPQSK